MRVAKIALIAKGAKAPGAMGRFAAAFWVTLDGIMPLCSTVGDGGAVVLDSASLVLPISLAEFVVNRAVVEDALLRDGVPSWDLVFASFVIEVEVVLVAPAEDWLVLILVLVEEERSSVCEMGRLRIADVAMLLSARNEELDVAEVGA